MQQDQQPKSPSGRGFPLKWTSLALLLLLMILLLYAGCSMTTVSFSPIKDGDFSIGYLPVNIIEGNLEVLDSYHRDYAVPGYGHRKSDVTKTFYPWLTPRLDTDSTFFLLFHIKTDYVPGPPGKPHLARGTSHIVGPPRIFRPTPAEWENHKATGTLPLKPLAEYPIYETEQEFKMRRS